MSTILILASAIAIADGGRTALAETETVDLIEINHTYGETGEPRFHQMIYWRWRRGELRVAAWRMISEDHAVTMERGVYVDRFWHNGLPVSVKAKCRRETWTQYDPELRDRDFIPAENRQWKLW